MKTTKKWIAFLLSFALMITLFSANEVTNANTATTNSITVTLRVEDANGTLIPATEVELTAEDVAAINETYVTTTLVESEPVEQPLFTTTNYTAAHALAKYVSTNSEALTTDLTFSWGNPSYIKGEETLDYYPSWSYRVNNVCPVDSATGYSYNAIGCPIQDGDTIVFFRQACYDANAGSWGAYTSYSWFDKTTYEATTDEAFTVTYQKDDGFATTTTPASEEAISVYDATNALIQTVTTTSTGTASICIEKAGSYTLVAGKNASNGIPELSKAFARVTVTEAAASTVAPTATPESTPAATVAPTTENTKKTTLATPKKVKAKATKKKVKVSWKKVKNATGYEVVITGKKSKKIRKTTKKTSLIKKLKKGRYTIKVRSYKKQKKTNIYSTYSKKINVTIKA